MPEQNGEKTQDPTPHRRQEARKHGQVARSQDLGSAVLLLAGLLVLLMSGGGLVGFLTGYCRNQLGGSPWLSADVTFAVATWQETIWMLAKYVLPLFGALLLVGVGINLAQVGFLFVPEKIAMDPNRINPLSGFQRIFSLPGTMHLVFGLFKVLVITAVALVCLYKEREAILGLTVRSCPEIAKYLGEILLWTSIKIGIALLILAILDFAFQRWKHEQDLKMTPQEVREELKNLEGDPQIAARRRVVQRQLALNRVSAAVPKADVVVTNPTELAVAIQYEPDSMAAPIVVAKGAGVVAQRIRKLALEHGIPIIEKKPLAQALYHDVDVNRPIPPEQYAAVAEILAYVYQLKGKSIPGTPSAAA